MLTETLVSLSARAHGEKCGGRHNVLGVCAAGLRCFVEFKDDPDNNILKVFESILQKRF
jgi:hypothetical protein